MRGPVTLLTTAVRWQTSAGAYSALLEQTLYRGAGPYGVRDYGSVLTSCGSDQSVNKRSGRRSAKGTVSTYCGSEEGIL